MTGGRDKPEGSCELDTVVITDQLRSRPSRAPDHEAEARAMAELADTMANAPRRLLQKLCECVMEVCRGDSAGVSILEGSGDEEVFRWYAIAGAFAGNVMGTMPRSASPCGTVVEKNVALLFDRPARYFRDLEDVDPAFYEALNVPFCVSGEPVGTLWALGHTPERQFDAEDARLLTGLSRFASAAYQVIAALDTALEREEQYRELVEQVKDHAIFRTDLDGRAVTWNQGVERVLGFAEDEFIGLDVKDAIFTPEDIRAGVPEQELQDAARDGAASNDRWMRRKNGEHFFALGTTTAIKDQHDHVIGYTKLMRDYTAVKRAEDALQESEERFRLLAELSPDAMLVSLDGRYVYANAAAAAILGASRPEQLIGRSASDFLYPEHLDTARERTQEMVATREPAPLIEYKCRRLDGSTAHVEVASAPTVWEGRRAVQVVGRDVTARKRAEEALDRARNELEQRVAERTWELKQRAEQLARLSSELSLTEQRERQRLAHVLHDHLQQLLVGAKLRLDLFSRGLETDDRRQISAVGHLIDEAIGASRSLTVELAPPILHEAGLAAGLEWLARWILEKHGLTIHLDADDGASPKREDVRILLFQSVRELLFNVVKHSGVDEASVEMTSAEGDRVKVVVSDRGRGFDLDALLNADPAEEQGFGLFSIRERLSLLGGRFEIDSKPGEGSRFTLLAPKQAAITGRATAATAVESGERLPERREASQARGERIRVLVVDDHHVLREGLDSLLSGESDIEVVGEAADGLEAIERAQALQPDVILMDFSMPNLDGVEATRRIKSALPHVQIVGLSMYEEPDRGAAMINAGASAYMTKSGRSEDLLEVIYSVFEDRRTREP